jgi:hypothetical protein
VGGYVTLYGLITGKFELGIVKRTYLAFEQGQGFAYEYNPGDGQIEARRLFGTPEENKYSVISAIKRNPKVFLQRVQQTARTAPKKIYFMYGERLGIIFLLLAAIGLIGIARKRLYLLLLILLLWPAHLLVYFITFFRYTYFLFPYFVMFSLTAVGLNSIMSNFGKRMLYFWSLTLFGFIIWGILSNRPNIFSATLFFLIGLWIIRIIMNRYQNIGAIRPIGLILGLCFVLFLKGGYPYPQFRVLGISPCEKASLFMKEHLASDDWVYAFAPRDVFNAKSAWLPLSYEARNFNEKGLSAWIAHLNRYINIRAIYVDSALRIEIPTLHGVIQKLIGKELEVGFKSDDGETQVLLVNKKALPPQTCSMKCHHS